MTIIVKGPPRTWAGVRDLLYRQRESQPGPDSAGGFLIPRPVVADLIGCLAAQGLVANPEDPLVRHYRRLYNRRRTHARHGYDRRARRRR